MREHSEGLVDELNLDYLFVSPRFSDILFVACHQYWACNCGFEMRMSPKSLAGHYVRFVLSVELFELPPHHR